MNRLALFWLAALLSLPALAAPRIENAVLSNDREGKAVKVFAHDTPKIFLRGKLVDVIAGSTVKTAWIAAKTDVAPRDYVISTFEAPAQRQTNDVVFSLSKPTTGWPAGQYRVEVSVDGKVVHKSAFTVEKEK